MEHSEINDRKQLWQERLKEFTASGMTQKEWCQKEHISTNTLRYWRKKLQSDSSEIEASGWITVVPPAPIPSDQHSEITLQNAKVKIILSPSADLNLSHELLQVLMRS